MFTVGKVAQQADMKWYTPFSVPVETDLKTKIQIFKAKLGSRECKENQLRSYFRLKRSVDM